MNSRDLILRSLRNAQVKTSAQMPPVAVDSEIYADSLPENETMIQRFEKIITQLKGEFYSFRTPAEAAEFLHTIIKDLDPGSCLSYDFELLNTLISVKTTLKDLIQIKSGQFIPADDFAQFEVGITRADYLIARTGSVVVSSITGGGRRLSILPPVHIVLALNSQLVSSIEDVWADMADHQKKWSTLSIISGPSRTSDIEKQLVLGAHGPKRLVVILVDTEESLPL